jgi:hypothetical protein
MCPNPTDFIPLLPRNLPLARLQVSMPQLLPSFSSDHGVTLNLFGKWDINKAFYESIIDHTYFALH